MFLLDGKTTTAKHTSRSVYCGPVCLVSTPACYSKFSFPEGENFWSDVVPIYKYAHLPTTRNRTRWKKGFFFPTPFMFPDPGIQHRLFKGFHWRAANGTWATYSTTIWPRYPSAWTAMLAYNTSFSASGCILGVTYWGGFRRTTSTCNC